jgi:hypothetical protein
MFAAGRPGDPEQLPQHIQEREKPSDRMSVSQFICEGAFAFGKRAV